MFQNKVDEPPIWKSDLVVEKATDQPVMILTDEILKKTPDTRLFAIHNYSQDGTSTGMNFKLSNGYVTKQTEFTTDHRHVIPGAVFTHTKQVLVHYYGYYVNGFRFLDA